MAKIRVADFIAKRLVQLGAECVFMVTGGGAMHLNDAFGRNSDIRCIFNHHEQACSIAAEGYARSSGKFAVVNVTTGPGGLNTMTGLMGQWTDSVPVIYISGQVKTETTISFCPDISLRQLGDQECAIVDIVKHLTKYAISIKNPLEIKNILDTAVAIALSGRPGPVWIDIPMDIQGAYIHEEELNQISSSTQKKQFSKIANNFDKIISLLNTSTKPLIVAGHGIRISNNIQLFRSFLKKITIPVVTTFNAIDIVPDDHPLYIGRIGTIGQRAANIALQNADTILFLGTRNNIRQISYNYKNFAKNAKKIVVDIDSNELKKHTLKPDIEFCEDVGLFLQHLCTILENEPVKEKFHWVEWCKYKAKQYPVIIPEYKNSNIINPYYFIDILTQNLPEDSVIICGNGSACVCAFQAAIVKEGQRYIWNSGCASMGYDLPAALGASVAFPDKSIICITGDGSIMMNLQELQTIRHYNLPIKLFVLNNNGYQSIKQTQNSFFGKPLIGCDRESGISFPQFSLIAQAFNLKYVNLNTTQEIQSCVKQILSYAEPILCEVFLADDYIFSPKLSSKRLEDGSIISPTLDDMFPFLSQKEMKENIFIS